MTVSEFYAKTSGARLLSLSENEPALCPRDFWQKYRFRPEWNAEIENVHFIPHRNYVDHVICLILLKEVKS